MDSNHPEAWKRLGKQLTDRRGELGYGDFRRRADFHRDRAAKRMSYRTITRLEKGERGYYPPETLEAVADIYAVTRASIQAVLAGTGNLTPAQGAVVPKPSVSAAGIVSDGSADGRQLVVLSEALSSYERVIMNSDLPADEKIDLIQLHRNTGGEKMLERYRDLLRRRDSGS